MSKKARLIMTHEHNSEKNYDDLRAAIAATVFVQAKNGARIIASEKTGARDPWIFDFRALMLQPKWLNRYAEIFWQMYADKLPFQVGGMETAGIALVSAIIMKGVERGTPVNGFYIRKSRKRQGLLKFVEGTLTDEKIILVDDLINSGQTLNKQIKILKDLGKEVSDLFVMLAFRVDEAYTFFKDTRTSLHHLFSLKDFGLPILPPRAPEIPKESFDVLWRYQAPDPSFHLVVQKSSLAQDETCLYFGSDDGTFRALQKDTGLLSWEFKTGRHPLGKGILSSPAIHDETIFFGAYDGCVYALDGKTGAKKWLYDDADWVGSSPAIAPNLNLLFIGLEFGLFRKRGGIVALSMDTGREMWSAKHRELTHGSPLYIKDEQLVVIGSNDGVLYAYDAKHGGLRWQFATRGDIKTAPAYDPLQKNVIVASMDGRIYALSAQDGNVVFARQTEAGMYSTPLVENSTLFVSSLDKNIYAIDLQNWDDIWVFSTSGRIFASPLIADGSLWCGSNDGRLYELDPQYGKLRNFFQASERIVNKIAFDATHKRFFVQTVANEVYCLARKSPDRSSEK